MPTYGELAWRERKEERIAIGAIQGASSLDVSRNNGLPTEWEKTNKQGKKLKITADYIMRKTTIQNCAKAIGIKLESLYDLTGKEASDLHDFCPRWLYQTSPKKEVVQLLDDEELDEVRRTIELAIQRQIMFNKYTRQLTTGQQTFVGGDKMFVLVAKILMENAIMHAAARGSQSQIERQLKPLINLCRDATISDTEFRIRMLGILLELQTHMHKDLPTVFHEELDIWTRRHLRPHVDEEQRNMSEEDEESDDE